MDIRRTPGTADHLLQTLHRIRSERELEPAFRGGKPSSNTGHPKHIIGAQTWDPVEACTAGIRGAVADLFAKLTAPLNVTSADER